MHASKTLFAGLLPTSDITDYKKWESRFNKKGAIPVCTVKSCVTTQAKLITKMVVLCQCKACITNGALFDMR